MERKIDIKNRRIDCSDLAGTYTLSEMPGLLKKLQDRIDRVKDEQTVFVREAGFTERTKNTLLRADIDTLNELSLVTKRDILVFEGMGRKSFIELETVLRKYDLWYKIKVKHEK